MKKKLLLIMGLILSLVIVCGYFWISLQEKKGYIDVREYEGQTGKTVYKIYEP